MITEETGIPLKDWSTRLEKSEQKMDMDVLTDFISDNHYPHSVVVDMTASDKTTTCYPNWIKNGINVVTPNKKAGSGDTHFYNYLMQEARKSNRYFLYETTVGAGLPVLRTLRDLLETGDEIIEIEGVLSGTLSYLFSTFDGSEPFSEVLLSAKNQGFTEPDPREDLSGNDVGRKLVILAREAGLELERTDLNIESLVPSSLKDIPLEDFLKRASEMDETMMAKVASAKAKGEVLRYVGRLGMNSSPEVVLKSFPSTHPFGNLNGTDNIVLFRTQRYNKQPMVIQGPGAGPKVTAAGVFAELLRLADNLGAPQ